MIVGGGFGGLFAAKALKREAVRVTLIDRRNHHLFQPLLYQVATASLSPADIAAPIRKVLRRQKNAAVILGEAAAIDVPGKKVVLADGEVEFDDLIVATGAAHSYFGHDEFAPFAPGLKTLEDALEIRRRVLLAFEAAERRPGPEWLTFVIVGAGPTGVELAGALSEIARHTLVRDFRRIDPGQSRVVLLEGAPRVLPTYPEDLSEKARRQLERLGVQVRTGARVTRVDAEAVWIGEERIPARTTLWAAGVSASPLLRSLGAPLDKTGRVLIRPDLTIPGRNDIFVIGDAAALEGVPGVAPAAIQMGRHAARNIVRSIRGEPPKKFEYRDRGLLATIGRAKAVADLRWIHLSGFVAWAAWLLVHIFFLIGFRNRLAVLFEWAWVYFTWERGARLITGEHPVPASR